MINERDFFLERTQTEPMSPVCPQCQHRDDYAFRWSRRIK
jgi:hypothetical protein